MKYLREFAENYKYEALLDYNLVLDFEDIFLEIADEGSIISNFSYYDLRKEDWIDNFESFQDLDYKKINSENLNYNFVSISFYISTPLSPNPRKDRTKISYDIKSNMIDSIKRFIDYKPDYVKINISYRTYYNPYDDEYLYHVHENENLNDLESLLDYDLISMEIYVYTD